MKWRKLGKIFEPDGKIGWMQGYAALPIAEHEKNSVYKVYFTSRDKNNCSNIGSLFMELGPIPKILDVSDKPVVSPGELGTFDDSGTTSSCLLNCGSIKYLYYTGWNLCTTVPFRYAIGLAVSSDCGRKFHKFSAGPVADRSPSDPYLLASPFVIRENRTFKTWYVSGARWEIRNGKPMHYYHIKYAESNSPKYWEPKGIVAIDFKNKNEYAIGRPFVLKENGIYKMWFSHRGKAYRIGYAESKDGIKWTRKDDEAGIDVSKSGWDSEMIEYPFIIDHKTERFMFYNGNGYGKTGFGLAVLEK